MKRPKKAGVSRNVHATQSHTGLPRPNEVIKSITFMSEAMSGIINEIEVETNQQRRV